MTLLYVCIDALPWYVVTMYTTFAVSCRNGVAALFYVFAFETLLIYDIVRPVLRCSVSP